METNKYKNPMAQKTKCFSGYISGSDIESSWDWFFFFHNLCIWCPYCDREWAIQPCWQARGEHCCQGKQLCWCSPASGSATLTPHNGPKERMHEKAFFVCSASLTLYLVLDLFLLAYLYLLDAEEWLNHYLFKNWKYFLSVISRRAFKEFSGLKQI